MKNGTKFPCYTVSMTTLVILALIGAVQGAMVLLLILFKFRHGKNTALALLILVFSLRLGTIPTWNVLFLLDHSWCWPCTTTLPFLFGPLLYWCVRELSRETPAPLPLWPLHFLPFLIGTVLVGGMILGMSKESYSTFVLNVFRGHPPLWYSVLNGIKVLLNIVYVALTVKVAFGYRSKSLSQVHRRWLHALAIIPSVVLIAFGFVALDPGATARLSGGNIIPFAVLAGIMSIFIYILSFLVLLAPSGLEQGGVPLQYRQKFYLSEEECRKLVDRVKQHLEKGAFKDPDLSEQTLALALHIHPNRLSQAVNRHYRIPFRTLVNRSRLAYFLERVRRGALEKQTILDLAFEAGFPSKSTFNRVFKDEMHLTPTEYEKSLRQGKTEENGPLH